MSQILKVIGTVAVALYRFSQINYVLVIES